MYQNFISTLLRQTSECLLTAAELHQLPHSYSLMSESRIYTHIHTRIYTHNMSAAVKLDHGWIFDSHVVRGNTRWRPLTMKKVMMARQTQALQWELQQVFKTFADTESTGQ